MKNQIKIYKYHTKGKKFIKAQNVEDLKVTTHEEYNQFGKLQSNHYVEFTIIGNNRTWPDFMEFDDFKQLNPQIKL